MQNTPSKVCFLVEMAGIEPASERIDPQISTSVVILYFSLYGSRMTMKAIQPATGTRKPLFRTVSGVTCGTPTFCRPISPPAGDRGEWTRSNSWI
jgi:hypothetical protein